MAAIRFKTTVDETMAGAMPKLRPLIGRKIEVTATAAPSAERDRSSPLDEFLDHRLKRPEGVEPVTLDDMERAIAEGAMGGGLPAPQ